MFDDLDFDDVGSGFLWGGLLFGIVIFLLYMHYTKPRIDECTERGGIMVKQTDGKNVCIEKPKTIQLSK